MSDQKPKLYTPECMLGSYPNLFEPGMPDDRGNRYYECDLLIPPKGWESDDGKRIRAASAAAMKEHNGGELPEEWKKGWRKAPSKKRQKDGSSYYPAETFGDWILLKVKSKNQPGIVDARVKPIIEPADVHAGMWVRCTINPFAFSNKGNIGVSFWLNTMQVLRKPGADDPKVAQGGGGNPADDFEPVGDVGDVDDMFDGDDEIPF